MAGITKQRFNEIQEAAMKMVASYGVHELDALEMSVRYPIARGFAAQLMAEFGIKMDAARRHIAKACRRQRHPNWQPSDEWGGQRDGTGRKAKVLFGD